MRTLTIISLASVLAVSSVGASKARWTPQMQAQFAQASPGELQFFRDARNPKTHIPCCSIADGSYAEEDSVCTTVSEAHSPEIECHYRARFMAIPNSYDAEAGASTPGEPIQSDWMDVPPDTVITDPNRHGAPVVWYYFDGPNDKEHLRIRCYAPGGGF